MSRERLAPVCGGSLAAGAVCAHSLATHCRSCCRSSALSSRRQEATGGLAASPVWERELIKRSAGEAGGIARWI